MPVVCRLPNSCLRVRWRSWQSSCLLEDGVRALQYAPTEGLPTLRDIIAERVQRQSNEAVTRDMVLVVSGSQQALDLTGKVFLDEGDAILCESPTYLGAINAFRAYQPRFVEVATDDDGMIPADLERRLAETDRVKLIYTVPDFQNPSGRRWSLDRRRELVELGTRYGVTVIEDSPYAELCFEGTPLPAVATFDDQGVVVRLGTLSKLLSPGMRLGWVVAESSLVRKYVLAKQGADLHTSSLSQLLAERFITECDFEGHIARIRQVYRSRCRAMVAAIEENFPEDIRFTRPAGGLFLWVELPAGVDARKLLELSLEEDRRLCPRWRVLRQRRAREYDAPQLLGHAGGPHRRRHPPFGARPGRCAGTGDRMKNGPVRIN